MKLYILSHEDRNQDATFFSPLTKQGLENATKLIKELEKVEISHIYCSPYIRTLQTIHPYSKKHNLKIKLEYGLSEINHEDIIPKKSYQVRLPEYMAELFNYEPNYNEKFAPEEFTYPENEKNVYKRVRNILKYIISVHNTSNDNIVLVTHQIVCKLILKIVKKYGVLKPNKEDLLAYPKGGLTEVFDNTYWVFKPINWKST
jgi:broad specificity phosphatase PhoE